jgi:hypothetical protein
MSQGTSEGDEEFSEDESVVNTYSSTKPKLQDQSSLLRKSTADLHPILARNGAIVTIGIEDEDPVVWFRGNLMRNSEAMRLLEDENLAALGLTREVYKEKELGFFEKAYDDFKKDPCNDTCCFIECPVYGDSCAFKLESSESVYNDGVLTFATGRMIRQKHGKWLGGFRWIAAFGMLVANATLQLAVTSRIRIMVLMDKRSNREIFDLCIRRAPGELPIDFHLQPQDSYWDCSPFMSLLMHNASLLDVNGDGKWSPADDLSKLTGRWGSNQRQGNLTQILTKYLSEVVEKGTLLHQANMTRTESFLSTTGFFEIPMPWLLEEQPIIDLCLNTNEHVCSNLEKRGILKEKIRNSADAYTRVEKCRDLTAQCEKVHGEVWRSYRLIQKQTCGSKSSWFDAIDEITMTRFSDATAYDNISNAAAITSSTYIVFLALCLTTWWLVIVEEAREVLNWWMAVLFIPVSPPEGKQEAEETEEDIIVNSINYYRKALIIVLVMIPRSIVVLMLAWYGSLFLVGTDGYTDLILNSVALAFLIEVDEALYAAVSSDEMQQSMDKQKPIEGTPGCFRCCKLLCNLPTVIPFMILVFTIVFYMILDSYTDEFGKLELAEAYQCLCHGEGLRCVAAQVWGVSAHLDPKWQPGVLDT